MTDFMKLLQQAQEIKGKMEEMQEQLRQKSVTGTSGGGMVTVEADGKGDIKKIRIDPSVVNAADVEMLEDLVVVAVTEAQRKAAELAKEEMTRMAGGLPFKLPF